MESQATYPEVLTVEEFARVFRLSPEAVRKLIRVGEIPAIRIGKQFRIPQQVVDRYFSQAVPAESRGFGMWRQKPIDALKHVNDLRSGDRRPAEAFLKDIREDA